MLERDVRKRLDGVDGAIAVVAGRPDQGDGRSVHRSGHPVRVHPGGHRIDGSDPQFDAEQVACLVERRVGGFWLDDVGAHDVPGRHGVIAIGQQRVADAPCSARRHQADRLGPGHGLGVQEVERHGDDLRLEPGCARAHVPLQHVDMREERERLVQEVVVIVVAAVHGSRTPARLPRRILLSCHRPQHGKYLVARHPVVGERPVYGHAIGIGKGAHGVTPRSSAGNLRSTSARYSLARCGVRPHLLLRELDRSTWRMRLVANWS